VSPSKIRVFCIDGDPKVPRSGLHPALIADSAGSVLVDCGCPGQLELLERAAADEQVDLAGLSMVVATHHDFDHVGSLAAFKRKYPRVRVAASAEDAPYVEGRARSLRLEQAEHRDAALPAEQQEGARRFRELLASVEPVAVDRRLSDGERLGPGGARVVATPGHMPGHISIWVEEERTLIAGDALVVEEDELRIAHPQYTLELERALASVERLSRLPIERVVCYHGGSFEGDVAGALRRLLARGR